MKFILLCIVANLLVFFIRRMEAKDSSSRNYIPDYGVTPYLLAQVPRVIEEYGKKATRQYSFDCDVPRSVKIFFDQYESISIGGGGIVIKREYLKTPYKENADFLMIGTISYGEDVILVHKTLDDESIYIVSCEDGDPNNPEVYATNFKKFIAMGIREYLDENVLALNS